MLTTPLTGGRGWLDYPAAASLHRIDAQIGHLLDINEAGRSFFQQEEFYNAWRNGTGSFALSPYAPSIHQLGNAIDTDEQITAILNDHGWFHTVFWPDGSLRETWHYEYDASRDNHINDPEDDMPTMGEFLNTPAYDGGPTISQFFKNVDQGGVATQVWARTVDRGPDGQIPALQELADAKTVAMRAAGRPINDAVVDEAALAASLAPLLAANLGSLSDADVERIAKASADEQAKRLAT